MPRLIIAVIIALGLHVLLLMTILPQQQVVVPELKGSGQVTVSIVRRSPSPLPEVAEEAVKEPELTDQQKEAVQHEQKVEQVPLPGKVPPPRRPELVKDTPVPMNTVSENRKRKKVARKILPAEPVPEKLSATVQNVPLSNDEMESSEIESLRQPEPLKAVNRPPAFPPLARKRGWQGIVLLEVDVQSDGMVKNIQIKQSSSYDLLDKEALKAVRKWRFSPGFKAGEPVPMKVIVPIHFLLQDN